MGKLINVTMVSCDKTSNDNISAYINPEYIIAMIQEHDYTHINFIDDKYVNVVETADEIVKKIESLE